MAEMLLVNPRKRKTRRKIAKKPVKRRSSTTLAAPRKTKTVRRRRRNPAPRSIIRSTVMPAATAAGGALALDVIMGLLPVPATLKTGPLRHVVKGAGAIGMGMAAGMFVKPETARLFATGALTVAMHDAAREMVGRFMPGVPLAGNDDYDEFGFDEMLGYQAGGSDAEFADDSLGIYEENLGAYVGEYNDDIDL